MFLAMINFMNFRGALGSHLQLKNMFAFTREQNHKLSTLP